MYDNYIGIDPGQSGGLCIISKSVDVIKMPDTESDIWDWFDTASKLNCFAVIEKVHSMPGQGVASTFKFGQGYGTLRMALIAAKIPFEEIPPRSWQKKMGIVPKAKTESKTDFKNRLKGKAQQLFPEIKMTLSICDAVLIAEYNRRNKNGII